MSVFEGDSPPAVLLERLQVFRAGSYIHLLYLSMDKSCDDFRTAFEDLFVHFSSNLCFTGPP